MEKTVRLKAKYAMASVLVLSACATAVKYSSSDSDRSPSSYGGQESYPAGLAGDDAADFEHLSEGSDIYPYEWMLALKSASAAAAKGIGLSNEPFLSRLDTRFGLMKSVNRGHYLMPYVGMSAAWSNMPPQQSDARDNDGNVRVRDVNGVKSIRMVGTNCAMCHNGEVRYNNKTFRIDGAPAITDIRGYFQELAKSTIATIAKKEQLAMFLRDLSVPDWQNRAVELNSFFNQKFGLETSDFNGRFGGAVSTSATLLLAQLDINSRIFRGKDALAETFLKLLKLTYRFNDSDKIGELKNRMDFLGTLMVGTDPNTSETKSGYSRTDAFGRIGNLVLRGTNPIPYTAPVSLPWIWGIKNMAMLHYTANTNSVMLRNIGQSLGLGALILDDQGHSTVNIYNLDRLENLVHKIQVPQWQKIFAGEPALKIRDELIPRGKMIYENKCAHCHETQQRVGPQNALYNYKLEPLNSIGTDPTAAQNIIVPVGAEPFQKAIFEGVERVKLRYYQTNLISQGQQDAYEWKQLRGNEFFRDTLIGYRSPDDDPYKYGDIDAGYGYMARHLSGVWATGPYLHNGSVPTLWDLLQPASARPKLFNVQSHDFDPVKLGYMSARPTDLKTLSHTCAGLPECFDTSPNVKGNANGGHEGSIYGTDMAGDDKMALLEYLKVLPPEPEYRW